MLVAFCWALRRLRHDRLVVSPAPPGKTSLASWRLGPGTSSHFFRSVAGNRCQPMSSNEVLTLSAVAGGLAIAAFRHRRGSVLRWCGSLPPAVGLGRPPGRAQGPPRPDAAGRRSGDLADDGRHSGAGHARRAELGRARSSRGSGQACQRCDAAVRDARPDPGSLDRHHGHGAGGRLEDPRLAAAAWHPVWLRRRAGSGRSPRDALRAVHASGAGWHR